MSPTGSTASVRYELDGEDRIRWVSPSWMPFAAENHGCGLEPERIVGRPIWDFLAGLETCHLFQVLHGRVRATGESASFPFRCDSPTRQRELMLRIEPLPGGSLRFSSTVLRETHRAPVLFLDPDDAVERLDESVLVCSWCKRVRRWDDGWEELPAALEHLGFAAPPFPRIHHGVCPTCYAAL